MPNLTRELSRTGDGHAAGISVHLFAETHRPLRGRPIHRGVWLRRAPSLRAVKGSVPRRHVDQTDRLKATEILTPSPAYGRTAWTSQAGNSTMTPELGMKKSWPPALRQPSTA